MKIKKAVLKFGIVCAAFFFPPFAAFGYEECHMYTPYEYQRMGGAYKIGPYSSDSQCESVNSSHFGGGGRCECDIIEEPPTATGYPSGGTEPTVQQPIEPDWNQQWENQEKIRQEREAARQREIEEKAKRDAEARRRELEWKQNKEKLISSLKESTPAGFSLKTGSEGSSSGDFKLKTASGEVELKPAGTDFFGTSKEQGQSSSMGIKETVLDHTDSGKQTLPSSESENLRRSFWLYQRAAAAKNPEEAHFLSQQADEAAQGHPLLVEVPPTDKTPDLSKAELEQFERLAEAFEKDRATMDTTVQKREHIEQKQTLLQNKFLKLRAQMRSLGEQPATPPSPPEAKKEPDIQEAPELKKESEVEQALEPKQESEAQEAPVEVKKPKGGEELRAELAALQKEIQETNDEAARLSREEGVANQAFEKSQSDFNKFLGKK